MLFGHILCILVLTGHCCCLNVKDLSATVMLEAVFNNQKMNQNVSNVE